jgi:Zn-dependent protease/CBS domain-containing protein
MPISISLGRLFGIPVGLHYSWLVIAALITLSLAGRFTATQPGWSTTVVWAAALATAVLFFASILLHELGHAVVARANQLPVRSITLFALGGVAQIEKEAASAGAEFRMAIAGPIVSVLLGTVCLLGASTYGWSLGDEASGVLPAMLGWLGYINLALATFNLIPGYPLDGGRVLRAALWRLSGDADKATRQAARTGQVVAMAFIGIGLFEALAGAGFSGLWLALIGWFLLQASRANYARVVVMSHLRDVRVGDVMTHAEPLVAADTRLETLVADFLRSGRRYSMVTDESGEVVGLVTLADIRHVDREEWAGRDVATVMRPLEQVRTVSPETPASDAFEILAREDVSALPVFDHRRLLGVLTRQRLLQLIRAHSEIRA